MKFVTSTIIVSALASLAAAVPQRGGGPRPGRPTPPTGTPGTPDTCLTSTTASDMVNGFASLLTAFDVNVANSLLASDFTDTSDSINFLAGIPLGSTTFPSKEAFIAGQGTQPPIGFTVLNIDAVTCDTIAFRWAATLGPQTPIKGINILNVSNLNGTSTGWQIKSVFSEFNSGTWSQQVGGQCA
ncbi:uncharacterized protein A1O9_01528 [Exophiala aquamarina CBS 119918]|uniref:NTF2-like domain-containing protein n=1 Tax=Exophiala aquamarina CBS 119918 TaxID=1182545 RepID=A0A072Q6J5_9EURO|nr:uncharacterized protein A1O9_01528 [Exophiala aquamarina CBS 119918]KEF63550.1 hypothetical protein A1O9_01528 [Exophiala aquamarina CBS 119918]